MNLRTVHQLLITWLVLAVCFTAGLVIAYCIPPSVVAKNAISSVQYIEADLRYSVGGNVRTSSSPSTVSIMLSMASHNESNPLSDSMRGGYFVDPDVGERASIETGIGEAPNQHYEWYWHGWLVFLRPLLVLTDYGGIKVLLWSLFLAGFAAVCVKIGQNISRGLPYMVSLGIAYATVAPHAVDSLAYFSPIIMSLVGCLLLVSPNHESPVSINSVRFFIVGAVTQYLDFLTFPALSLAIPLALWCIWSIELDMDVRKIVRSCVALSLSWALGYGLLWTTKWIVASVVLQENILRLGINQVLFRMGAEVEGNKYPAVIYEWNGQQVSPINSIGINLRAMFPMLSLRVAVVMYLIYLVCALVLLRSREARFKFVVLLGVSLIPYVWYAAACNHSIIHYYFTFRAQGATVFALLASCIFLIGEKQKTGSMSPSK